MSLTDEQILEMFDRSEMDVLEQQGGVEGFAKALNVDLENGISQAEIDDGFKERIAKYGLNILPDPPKESWCQFFIECYKDLMLQILLVAALLSVILTSAFTRPLTFESYIETISIFIAVLLVSIVQTQTNYAQQQSFLEINKLKNSYEVSVIRAGHEVQIKSTEVLKGDILSLKSGNAICADALFISGQDLKVNNSAQTGESDAIPVSSKMPFVLGGTAVETGFGHCLVVSIGEKTRSGDMMKKIQDLESDKKDEKSPLEAKLDKVAVLLTWVGLAGALLTFIVLLVYWSIDVANFVKDEANNDKSWTTLLPDLVAKIMTAITIFICAVPEGLPLAVTLSLGFSMKRMMADQNFVRHLNACETMGGATAICSDKTGTLTQNKMTVVRLYQIESTPQEGTAIKLEGEAAKLWAQAIATNSTAFQTTTTEKKKVGNKIEEITKTEFVGSSSECALLQLLEPWGYDYEKIRKEANILHVHEFTSARKKMSVIVKDGDHVRAYMKGGPDFCLKLCTHYLNAAGERKEITENTTEEIMKNLNNFAERSLRTMLLAYVDLDGSEMKDEWVDPTNVEKDLTIIGIVGIQDPLRPEVIKAVQQCREAGVVVRMVTGDFITTAKAIAKDCGILDESQGEIAMEGQAFAKLDKLELQEKVPHLRVMARSSPMDKLRLVSFLMEAGEVVAVTGDGSNDSPALKQADVGLSMGRCGTELAKMASDIVILDDNFNSIVSALKWGRCVYDNVRGFLQFQLTVNFSAMFVAFLGSIVLHDSPLKTIQLLWVNLIMDSFGALALATRGPSNALLKRPPYGRGDQLLNNVLIRNIAGHACYQIIVLLLLLFGYTAVFGLEYGTDDQDVRDKIESGLIFNTFVYMQVFNLLNARLAGQDMSFFDGLFENIYFIIIFFGIAIVQVILVQFCGPAFALKEQTGVQWAIALGFGLGSLVIGVILRLIRLPDHTSDNLNALRAERRELITKTYTGLSFEDQFKRHINAKGEVVLEGQEDNAEDNGKTEKVPEL